MSDETTSAATLSTSQDSTQANETLDKPDCEGWWSFTGKYTFVGPTTGEVYVYPMTDTIVEVLDVERDFVISIVFGPVKLNEFEGEWTKL